MPNLAIYIQNQEISELTSAVKKNDKKFETTLIPKLAKF